VKRVLPFIGRYQLQALTAEHLDWCYQALRKMGMGDKPCSPNTVRHTHKVISTALTEAVERDLILRNPAKKVSKSLVKGEHTEIQILTREQIHRLFESEEDSRYHPLWVFLLSTGCRRGEALTVHWKDIRWDQQTVSIKQTLEYVRGSESLGLERGLRLDRSKTKNGIRTIPLNDDVCAVLRNHQRWQEGYRAMVPDWEDHDLVFSNLTGMHENPDTVTEAFRRALKRTGIPHVRLHSLRHSFATFLFEQNVHIKAVSTILGHSLISVTADTYTASLSNVNHDAVAVLNGLVKRKSG
jgi:integrase